MKLKKIFDAEDRAREMGQKDFDSLILYWCKIQRRKMQSALVMSGTKQRDALALLRQWNGSINTNQEPLIAYINGGCWIAMCDKCGNTEYVHRQKRYVFCHVCGNFDGAARNVLFPEDIKAVERTALRRSHEVELEILNTQDAKQFCSSAYWQPEMELA